MPNGRESGDGRRICLFGGTFDPIHNAHLRIAGEAMREVGLQQVLFVPAGNPPHKDPDGVTPYADRVRMVELACAGHECFVASRLEESTGLSYTIDTIERFKQTLRPEDKLFFLIGSDAFNEITSWKRWQEMVRLTEFVVVERPGHEIAQYAGAVVNRLQGLALPISSSGIRQRLATGGPTPELAPAVRQYIEERGLYGARAHSG